MKSMWSSLVIAVVLVLSACAKDKGGDGGAAPVAVVPQANTCTGGQISSQYGCLPQGTCPGNYGLYNNSCVPGTGVNVNGGACGAGQIYTQYGCLPQGTCPGNYGLYNNSCIPAYANNGGYYGNVNGGYYNSYYYQNRNPYYGNGGGYYGNPYGGYYGNGGANAGFGAGFYIGGRVGVPGTYYGY
jgi:hypothetical protein